jgi:hypothetical protein
MLGGGVVPNALDGMGCFADGPNRVRLVRNHEIRDAARADASIGPRATTRAPAAGARPSWSTSTPVTTEPTVATSS